MDKIVKVEEPQKHTELQNFRIEGMKRLVVDRITKVTQTTRYFSETKRYYDRTRKLSENVETLFFDIIPITAEELYKKRMSGIPGFVLKKEGELFYAKIRKNIKLLSTNLLGNHKCAYRNEMCAGFKNYTVQGTGCKKVWQGSVGIERYEWINLGYETFNTFNDCFVVAECSHFKPVKCEEVDD